LSGEEPFQWVLINNYEGHAYLDSNGVPGKALFTLILTYGSDHFKTIINGKDTSLSGDKAILPLQLKCTNFASVETTVYPP
jgi:hypothetical protein